MYDIISGVISVKKEHQAGKREQEDDGRAGVGVMLQIRYQGGPHRGRDIWQRERGQRSRGWNKLKNSKEVTAAGSG